MGDYQQSTTEELGDIEAELEGLNGRLYSMNTLLERIAVALEKLTEVVDDDAVVRIRDGY